MKTFPVSSKVRSLKLGYANLAVKPAIQEDELLAWLRLARSENIGPITFYQLLDYFGSAQKAVNNVQDLATRGGRTKPIKVASLEEAEKELALHQKIGAVLITSKDSLYPQTLRDLPDAPPVLSILGDLEFLNKRSLAIVGARNASLNGKKFA